MLESVTSKSSVVYLDIYLEVFVKIVSFQETYYSLCINIILMLCWLHWFWLNQECTCKALRTSIVTSSCKHLCHVLFFTLLICVKKAHITFTSTPEYIVCTAQLDSCVDSVLYLYDSTSNNVEIRVCRSTIHVTLVTEYVSCTPKKMLVRILSKFLFQVVCNSYHASLIFFNILTFVYQVDIVETEIVDTQLIHNLETCISLIFSTLYSVFSLIPFIRTSLTTKLVTACST